ncbi:MAG TPA: protein translocase subunit SecF [Clostridiaceae bacterium]
MLKIIEKTKIWFAISLTIILIGTVMFFINGLNFAIDFTGGTVVKVDMGKSFTEVQKNDAVDTILKKYDKDIIAIISKDPSKPDVTVLEIKGSSSNLTTENTNAMFLELKTKYNLTDAALLSQDTIGATVGKELRDKAIMAIILASIIILIYIGIRFEFKFATAAIIALLHDVLITIAVYIIFKIPIDAGFIAAMLTVIGYSVNDTIVVFDRIRENQKFMKKVDVSELANASVTETYTRSIFTVLTVVIALVSVHIFVPEMKNFTTPLIVGIVSGCYSSIYIASPLWVIFKHAEKKKRLKTRVRA